MKGLSKEDIRLVQRLHDGDLSEFEQARAERLISQNAQARTLMAALAEIELGVRGAEIDAWERADAPAADDVSARAVGASPPGGDSLVDLAPLLERYHDGELLHEEAAEVEALMQERDEVAGYLDVLAELSLGVTVARDEAVDGVDFGAMWAGIDACLGDEASAAAAYDPEEHHVLLQRYHDGEVEASERERVEAWLEAEQPEVMATLSALGELGLSVNAAVELVVERAELDLWSRVASELDTSSSAHEEAAAAVTSLEARREAKARQEVSWWSRNRQTVYAVAATAVIAVLGGLLLGNPFAPRERVVVKERTIVIVDDVKYKPGTSVMVTSPTGPAVNKPQGPSMSDGVDNEAPTIIWMLDGGDEGDGGDEEPSKDGDQPI